MLWNGENLDFKRFLGKEKVHRNSIKITVDLWRRGWDSNPCAIARKLISSVVRLWQIHLWSRSFQAAL